MVHSAHRIEFGDFQTPPRLAQACCRAIARDFGPFAVAVEPTCGTGAFVNAVVEVFSPELVFACEINPQYLAKAQRQGPTRSGSIRWCCADFFAIDWRSVRESCGTCPTLFLGNPPWVTSSQIGSLGGRNLPSKRNVDHLRGIQAITGQGNFDISECMLRTILEVMHPQTDAFAFLVKKATARKLVRFAWENRISFSPLTCYEIDAKAEFGVRVDAVLVAGKRNHCENADPLPTQRCLHSRGLEESPTTVAIGWVDEKVVSNPDQAIATRHLASGAKGWWRSGVKHDAAKILEFQRVPGGWVNGLGQVVELETGRLYPLVKGADVGNRRQPLGERFLLLPQLGTNDDTSRLLDTLPLTHAYLVRQAAVFASRKSAIYRRRDRFSVFGIGSYTFKPWKVAICSLYKRLQFTVYGPHHDQPVVFDDTVNFLAIDNHPQARLIERLLRTQVATRFFESRLFWDAKRPITVNLLQSLDLRAVACEVGKERLWDDLKLGPWAVTGQGSPGQPASSTVALC